MTKRIIMEKLFHESTPFPYSLQKCEVEDMEPVCHIHPHCQITQNLKGKIAYSIDEQQIWLEEGDILLINSHIPHACEAEEKSIRRNMGFYPEMLEVGTYCKAYDSFLRILYSNMYPYILLKKVDCDRMHITEILEEIFSIPEKGYIAADGLIHNRIVDISIALIQWMVKKENKDIQRINSVLCRSMEYIEANCREAIQIRDVAEAAGLNPSYFSHCFKKNMGISFKQYLNRKRLEAAAIELTTTEEQISYIAFSCGFGSVTSFYQNFMDFYKLSPKRFRELNTKITS